MSRATISFFAFQICHLRMLLMTSLQKSPCTLPTCSHILRDCAWNLPDWMGRVLDREQSKSWEVRVDAGYHLKWKKWHRAQLMKQTKIFYHYFPFSFLIENICYSRVVRVLRVLAIVGLTVARSYSVIILYIHSSMGLLMIMSSRQGSHALLKLGPG